ncbi:MAG: hypothetical protein M3Q05_04865 [Bacteroidota bacterium]|nr:hypothetical protein [Bacteroidota bacterium]
MNMLFPKARFLLLAFLLMLNVNGLENSFNPKVQSQQFIQELDRTLPDFVSDSSLGSHPNREARAVTLAKRFAKANETTVD